MAFEVLSKRYSKTDIPWRCSATMADRAVPKTLPSFMCSSDVQQPWQIGAVLKPRWLQVIPIGSSATMADRAVLKRNFMPIARASSSATVADRAVLKRVVAPNVRKKVQQPWQIKRFSNISVADREN